MRFVKQLLVILAAVFVAAAARETQAQQTDQYVSCVRCHALPLQQARAQMQQHGLRRSPCSRTGLRQLPRYVVPRTEPGRLPAYAIFSIQSRKRAGLAAVERLLSRATPVSIPATTRITSSRILTQTPSSYPPLRPRPTSILPLFGYWGEPNQDPYRTRRPRLFHLPRPARSLLLRERSLHVPANRFVV